MSNESRLQLAAGTISRKSALEDTDQQTIARVLDLFHIPVGSRRKNIWETLESRPFPFPPGSSRLYMRLFGAGLGEALIQNALDNVPFVDDRPTIRDEVSAAHMEKMGPPFLSTLYIRPDRQRKTISPLLPRPVELYGRIGKGMETLDEDDVDPFFDRVMYECEHTIPVVLRNFLLWTDGQQDHRSVIVMCLDDVFVPSLPYAEYCRGRMSQPLRPSIITLVLKGANGSFDAIMEKFGWLLSWTSPRDTYSCVILLQKFDMLLRPNSQTSPLHQECRRSFVRSQSFSEGLLRVLHQGAQGSSLPLLKPSATNFFDREHSDASSKQPSSRAVHAQKCPQRYQSFSDDPDKFYGRILSDNIKMLHKLEKLCQVGYEDECERRGCAKKTKARCSQCKTMECCGADCLKWSEASSQGDEIEYDSVPVLPLKYSEEEDQRLGIDLMKRVVHG
ncbi:uncharacterized protein STEHIDRAFT_113045 [Stereum hirsutum FP-91666 SS1]|uniref:uncharacterized protein n=1 Tax=Stereum hirsutum (strain FP-91666) TaxID=721885 RepID=UPI0004449AE5|nr:uncharacterized protein STEHIDRAFT_113045 [Stereum hirsutum FP-91666 SS1]EIM83776.1 hypothetical protein STEHIDRAFT_113045 [Stereum hirsutum FP-91666 SS1]